MLESSKIFLDRTKNKKPSVAVILGSGLSNFFDDNDIQVKISYTDLPDFPQPTVEGHAGKLILGNIHKHSIVCMYGRSHIYEGHHPNSLAKPIRVLKEIGCKTLIVTNAAGSLNEKISSGSLMLINDHINWSGFNPLIGPNDDNFGPRFSDMSDAYNFELRKIMNTISKNIKIPLHNGVYVMYSGPNFETPAEIKALKTLGADAVGMSTVPEVIVANHCGIKCIGISIITNLAAGLHSKKLSHEETLFEAKKAENNVVKLIKAFIEEI